jgi:hypothetical protein
MSSIHNSLADLLEQIRCIDPDYLQLLTASDPVKFEEAFCRFLEKALNHLEKNSKNFQKLDEEGLSAVLAGALKMPGLTVSTEKNSNGHVDITVEFDKKFPLHEKLMEAKIYDGPAYHVGGMEQLIKFYATGREGRCWMIAYVRQAKIADIVQKLRDRLDADKPYDQDGNTTKLKSKWSFLSKHKHSSNEVIEIGHACCNMHTASAE